MTTKNKIVDKINEETLKNFGYVRTYKIACSKDVFCAIGDLIRLSQELERGYKVLGEKLGIKACVLSNKSLNAISNILEKEKKIEQKDLKNLKQVINIRNYINHKYFLVDFEKIDFDKQEKKLNEYHVVICEGIDLVNNLIDKKDGSSVNRSTIFDI